MSGLRALATRIPGLSGAQQRISQVRFRGSRSYWEDRYRRGDTSGIGSYGRLAKYKAEFLNGFVEGRGLETVIEFGCGDGNQLKLATYPRYLGIDVSETAIRNCIRQFRDDPSRSFLAYRTGAFADPAGFVRADVALSIDVLYHLVEDEVFEQHLRDVFAVATQFVVVYSSDEPAQTRGPHERHRAFTPWVERNVPGWRLASREPNPYPFDPDEPESSLACFFVYERAT